MGTGLRSFILISVAAPPLANIVMIVDIRSRHAIYFSDRIAGFTGGGRASVVIVDAMSVIIVLLQISGGQRGPFFGNQCVDTDGADGSLYI